MRSRTRSLRRSVAELDEKLFTVDFRLEDEHDARALFGLAASQAAPASRADWIRQLNDTYCQSISLECEYIEVGGERSRRRLRRRASLE